MAAGRHAGQKLVLDFHSDCWVLWPCWWSLDQQKAEVHMAVKSLSPLMNIMLIPGLGHWLAFSFAEVSHPLCDESFISPEHHHQGSTCCFSVSFFNEWHILPASRVCLSHCGTGAPDMELIRMLFYLIFRWILLWSSSEVLFIQRTLWKQSHYLIFVFTFIFHTSKQLPSFLTSCPRIRVITRTYYFIIN